VARDPREHLDRPVVVRRPQAARGDEQVVLEPLAEGSLEVGRIVADDGDPRRLDAETEQRAGEERPVGVPAIATDELGTRDDDCRARLGQTACQVVGVTRMTRGL
jgi:hypothetical protein